MATIITSDCINCGACEPECPNTAIYAGAAPWELNGQSHDALAEDIYYIVPTKCSECVGFYDHEACAAVCPVDCCVTDPNRVESEAVLLARARELHPDKNLPDDAPSRFRKADAGAPASAPGPAAPKPASAAAPQPATAVAMPKPGASSPSVLPTSEAPAASDNDEFDPAAWQVPVVCKDCNAEFAVPYRQFLAGVVFRCPECLGSFVPTSELVRMVRGAFERFYTGRKVEHEQFERRRARELSEFDARRAATMEGFRSSLHEMARRMKPAGKFVRPRGLGAMFS